MPSRPELRPKGNRPNSAIYLGNSPTIAGSSSSKLTPTSSSLYETSVQTPPSLPDLPEPPSPDSSPGSRGSGLPSPPATNSTGSGSTGDPGSIALRQRPLSLASDSSGSSHRTVSEHSATRSRSVSRSSQLRDEPLSIQDTGDYEDENDDLDGDQTARLDRRHQTNEHNLALQRVKSLAERNRMAIDKLSSRLGSPSPSVAPSTTSSSRSRPTRTTLPADYGASGSETERESTSASSSSRRPITPPSGNHHVALAGTPSPYRRLRQASTPESPHKARLSAESSPSKNSPSARRRKRESMASIQSYTDEEDEDGNHFSKATGRRERPREGTIRDITKSALAAVASSRTPLSARRRGALPQEFIESSDTVETRSVVSRRSEDVREHKRLSTDPVTPYRGPMRSSTVRETGRTSQAASRHVEPPVAETSVKRERRATLRGGSAESALRSPGRTLVSEGLRAAGLSRREEVAVPVATISGDVFRDRERRAATPSRERAATSMSNYRSPDRRNDNDEEPPRPPTSTRRQHRATYSMAATSESADTEAVARPQRHSAAPRHSEPVSHAPKRVSQPGVTSTEHVRLMMETLQAFELNVAKMPSEVTQAKASSASELLKHALHVVHTTERINNLMRQGTSKALEEQIQAEVDIEESIPAEELLHVWRAVGTEYREGLRASDDLVRALTSFLIEVGSTLRKLTVTCGEREGSSSSPHVRSMSLEEDGGRSQTFSGSGYSLSGRKSVDLESLSRRSRDREEALRKLGSGGTGRESSLGHARASPALAAFRDRAHNTHETPSPASGLAKPPPSSFNQTPTNQGRRLFTPSQQRERELETRLESGTRRSSAMRPSDSQKTVLPPDTDVEPSPTPGSRIKERTRAPPAVPASDHPPPSRVAPVSKTVSHRTDSSSASESVQRSTSTREHERRKPSIASIVTIRGSQAPPNLTTPSTALTGVTPTTVSHSPDDIPALLRTDSSKSRRSGITFSRPSTSALTGIQQAREGHRKSSYSVSSAAQMGIQADDAQAPTLEPSSSRTFSKARTPPDMQTPRRPGFSPRVSSTESTCSIHYAASQDQFYKGEKEDCLGYIPSRLIVAYFVLLFGLLFLLRLATFATPSRSSIFWRTILSGSSSPI